MSLATRGVLLLLTAAFCVLMGIQGLSRYVTYHNQTYDLALYARQAWGLAHGVYRESIVGAHFLGSHIALVLWPLGLLGRVFGVVQVLLVAQVLAFGLATLPLAQLAARRFGDAGGLCAAALWMAYPNISHVATYEFHPGSLGVLPLAIALNALDQAHSAVFALSCLMLMLCRADYALLVVMLAIVAFVSAKRFDRERSTRLRRSALAAALIAGLYLALQFLWLRPRYATAEPSSYDLHFPLWGGSPFGIFTALVREPGLVVAHFAEPARLSYPLLILWPLGFLPLLAPLQLLPALPYVAINLISTFPTTTEMHSHYLTPAVPPLVAAAFYGLRRLRSWIQVRGFSGYALYGLCALVGLANWQLGALPWSREFPADAFRVDAQTLQARRTVALIPDDSSVQAPDPLLPHLYARRELYRAPPPEHAAEFVVLDITHRQRYAHSEDLLRTQEEPLVRRWLSREDFGLVHAEPSYLLFAKGEDPRAGPAARYLAVESSSRRGTMLTRCLDVASAWLQEKGLLLELTVHAPCPSDLALKILATGRPERVDLLFDGLLSPAHLRDEQVYTWHALSSDERRTIQERGLALGVIRADGAPPETGDPRGRPITLIR